VTVNVQSVGDLHVDNRMGSQRATRGVNQAPRHSALPLNASR
jgi:hypothetical protein